MKIPENYLEKIYSGILGKLIGVFLGRPFEGWTYEKITKNLGSIEYFVHEKFNSPLVVTDDDISGTFTFVRALEDNFFSKDLTSKEIGNTWLNYIIENRSIFWWGGNGISTEHTAWLNLKKGIKAPESGSIKRNGKTVAEQIGAQIFIDGWALISPGNPKLAAKLAKQASRVSHDGESVYAAQLWAAMESEAFVSDDIHHLIKTGLSVIPDSSMISTLVKNIIIWHKKHKDWKVVRQLIDHKYGYEKFQGNCHVIPNHAIMIMSLLYAGKNFHLGQKIVNTSGWDTDCNAGNLGCLHGIMMGLEGLNSGPDWRGPISDRMLISSADGGNSINDAVRMSYYIANLGRKLLGENSLPKPKKGSQFHFSLPGSTQGFQISKETDKSCSISLSNISFGKSNALEVKYNKLLENKCFFISTPTFANMDVLKMRTYELMATPLIYPGQIINSKVYAKENNNSELIVCLRISYYGDNNILKNKDSVKIYLAPGSSKTLNWKIPNCEFQPISQIGIVAESRCLEAKGELVIDSLSWHGKPNLILKRPNLSSDFWHRAWINGVDNFYKDSPHSFTISQNSGLGLISHGTREWENYKINASIVTYLGEFSGLIGRFQGMRRFYAARLCYFNQLFQIIRVYDESITVLASKNFKFNLEESIPIIFKLEGKKLSASIRDLSISVSDDSDEYLNSGGIGMFVYEGSVSTDAISIS